MSDDANYTTMSGAEFKRAVGADPDKWAAAFVQRGHMPAFIHADMAAWFRDAMEAAVAEHERQHGYALEVVDAKVRGLISDAEWEKVRAAMEAAVKAAGRQECPPDPEWDENRRRARVARENEVARRHSGEPSE